ncbi:hypothetical protein JVU11DRAFT_9224 [Chiua virens]|nr:hypothetical protein JVU11DRAFT_9224 [Chiua virens]
MYTFFESESCQVFASPNTPDALPATILPRLLPGKWSDVVRDTGELRWMSAQFPHMPYAVRRSLSGVPLFSCLYEFDDAKHIIYLKGEFSLHSDLLERWVQLETFLTQVYSALPAGGSSVVMSPVPSDAAYTVSWSSKEDALQAVERAIGSFRNLITLCAWRMSYSRKSASDPTGDPLWVQILLGRGTSPTMVEMLRTSPVAEFSKDNPRAGAVVDVKDEDSLPYILPMVNAQVPVYIFWGTWDGCRRSNFKRVSERVVDAEWINRYCYPSEVILKSAVDGYGRPSTFSSTPQPGPSSVAPFAQQSPPTPTLVAPRPHKGSGQRRGETWQEFFARRAAGHLQIMKREPPKEKQKRDKRIQNAKAGRAPGRKGANVFYWEEENGFRIRTPIGFNNYTERWSDYHGAQRRYDPFADEWDLCTEFDATAESDCFDESGDEHPGPPRKPAVSPSVTSQRPTCPSTTPANLSSDQLMPRDTLDGLGPSARDPESTSQLQPGVEPPVTDQLMTLQSQPEVEPHVVDQQMTFQSQTEVEPHVVDQQMTYQPQPEVEPPVGDQPMACDPQPVVYPPSDPHPYPHSTLGGAQFSSSNTLPPEKPKSVTSVPMIQDCSGNKSSEDEPIPSREPMTTAMLDAALKLWLNTSGRSDWFPLFLHCGPYNDSLDTFSVKVNGEVHYLWIPSSCKVAFRLLNHVIYCLWYASVDGRLPERLRKNAGRAGEFADRLRGAFLDDVLKHRYGPNIKPPTTERPLPHVEPLQSDHLTIFLVLMYNRDTPAPPKDVTTIPDSWVLNPEEFDWQLWASKQPTNQLLYGPFPDVGSEQYAEECSNAGIPYTPSVEIDSASWFQFATSLFSQYLEMLPHQTLRDAHTRHIQ